MNKITDTKGNYIEFEYATNKADIRPTKIRYTGNKTTGLSPYASVDFTYTNRPDSNEIYQSTIVNALKQSSLTIDAVAFGDMFCNGIADYRRSYIEPAGWECVFPLLGEDSDKLANEIIERGIEAFLVTIDTNALSAEYCGRAYTKSLVENLPNNIDPCGEDGEFHTLVTKAPSFNGEIKISLLDIDRGERFVHQRYLANISRD